MIFGPQKSPFKIRPLKKRRDKKKLNPSFLSDLSNLSNLKNVPVFRYAAIAVVTILLTSLVYFQERAGEWFKASILEAPLPFNGTVMPVDKVPNWTHWNGDASTKFSQIPSDMLINLPPYDLAKMAFDNDNLIWGNASHDTIRNIKITYPVVYLGDYTFEHQEGVGSHLAVDIKMPIGTPVRTIANGRVVKTSMTESGFGHHVVIEHVGVPDPDNSSQKTTLYSAFNHMDEVHVKEGQNVTKGQIIGTSGNTGTSTTPHLHFQLDRGDAPWHPYWAFSWAESQAAGLSFFEAVNNGLGLSNAKKYTVNPMTYVTEHLTFASVASADLGNPNLDPNSDDAPENTETTDITQPEVTDENPPVEVVENPFGENGRPDTSLFTFKLTGEKVSMINNGITITAEGNSGELNKLSDTDEIRVELSGVGRLLKKAYQKSDFINGVTKITVNSPDVGIANVLIGKSSHQISFVDKVESIASLRLDHDGAYQKNRAETITILAVDANGNLSPAVNFSGIIQITAEEGAATFNPDTLSARDFVNGKALVKVTVSNQDRLVIRAQNGAILGKSDPLNAEAVKAFSDVSPAHPHYDAIQYLYHQGIIDGYPDGTFKPEKTVNRAEALKMLMGAFNVESGPSEKLNFSDTDDGAWYATYLGAAVRREIVAGYSDGTFRPADIVNKAEYLKILFLTNDMKVNESITANPYADVPYDTWYAPYAYLLNRKNLLDVDGNRLNPGEGMTRGEVAETIYRLKHILQNNLLTYSR